MNLFIKLFLTISILTKLTSAVLHGTITELDEYPWMALIGDSSDVGIQHRCAGSLISDRYVITSGNCAEISNLTAVRLGEWDKTTNPDCIIYSIGKSDCADGYIDVPVEEIIVHPMYSKNGHTKGQNDIALLRLKHKVIFSRTVKPIALPTNEEQRDNMYDNRQMEIAGWGVIDIRSRQASDRKLKATVTVKNFEKCKETFTEISNAELITSQICAIGGDGSDACSGDSGGPLMVSERFDKHEQYYLAGIISTGIGCGSLKYPGIYTRVGAYIDWINAIIEK